MKIAIIDFLAIGDLIMATPAIRMIRAGFPKAAITVFCLSSSSPVLVHNPDIDDVKEVAPAALFGKKRLFHLPFLLSSWRKEFFDLAVSFHAGRTPNLLVRLFRAKHTILPGKGNLSHVVAKDRSSFCPGMNQYMEVYPEIAAEAIQQAGGKHIFGIPSPVLVVTDGEKQGAKKLLEAHGLKDRPFLGVFPGGGVSHDTVDTTRRYPGFREVLEGFLRKYPDVPLVFFGGKSDAPLCRELCLSLESFGMTADLSGKTDLRTFFALISMSNVLFTVDSSAMHAASALKIPGAAVFGPTDPGEKVDPRSSVMPVAPDTPKAVFTGRHTGKPEEAFSTFSLLSQEKVEKTLYQVWEKAGRKRMGHP